MKGTAEKEFREERESGREKRNEKTMDGYMLMKKRRCMSACM